MSERGEQQGNHKADQNKEDKVSVVINCFPANKTEIECNRSVSVVIFSVLNDAFRQC
jgi:hypothetical protein